MTKRKRRPSDEFPPGDSWIVLAPGAWFAFHVDTPITPSPDQMTEWMRRLRGAILADAFYIEEQLLKLSLADEFGTNDASIGGASYKVREGKWRREHSTGRKIERAKSIVRKHVEVKVADRNVQRLAEFGKLRNLFAHYPCWMVPVNDDELQRTISMELFIADGSHVWRVDELQAQRWGKLLHQVRVDTENLVRRLIGAPPLLPDGSPPPASRSGQGQGQAG